MLGKKVVKEYVPYVKSVNVVEKRAPTDESVKVLKELEDAAWNKILDTFTANDNVFSGTILHVNLRCDSFQYEIYLEFTLNGTKHIVKEMVDKYDIEKSEPIKCIYEKLAAEAGKIIASEIIKSKLFEVNIH